MVEGGPWRREPEGEGTRWRWQLELHVDAPFCVGSEQAGATALHIASANGNLVAVKALLEAGAKVRATDKVSNLNC